MESPESSIPTWSILSRYIYYSGRMIFHSLPFHFSLAAQTHSSGCSCNKLNGIYGMRWSKEWMVLVSCGFHSACDVIKTKRWKDGCGWFSFIIKSCGSSTVSWFINSASPRFNYSPLTRYIIWHQAKNKWFIECNRSKFFNNLESFIIVIWSGSKGNENILMIFHKTSTHLLGKSITTLCCSYIHSKSQSVVQTDYVINKTDLEMRRTWNSNEIMF